MDSRLREVMEGKESNYLLPFFWQHNDRHDKLAERVEKIYESGARAFCVESRPHEYFCEQPWWDDMDLILSEAHKRGMQVWIGSEKISRAPQMAAQGNACGCHGAGPGDCLYSLVPRGS